MAIRRLNNVGTGRSLRNESGYFPELVGKCPVKDRKKAFFGEKRKER
ncbi:hypothetical protein NEIFLAOT_01169 [Neisseria flavescens NRL30031/H210]|uniref:Uncharacterized protein n=1 Tax=Neisseria flavescens NRL30031/H210 TaxID=546264 RepID=C0EMJ8_NEIFL|nr:hypothetical protein NEIFLAOT_01169 [Neisseria flavescens NRL30031/H210]